MCGNGISKMNLKFSVLWFDDQKEYLDSLNLEDLEEEIGLWGFEPYIRLESDPDEFMRCAPFSNFDLLVIDYDLGAVGRKGEEFLSLAREQGVYTEIIFYSARSNEDLWATVMEADLDGIFLVNRNNVVTKIEQVGMLSIRKILDLNNVRGIVMAEVGEIDEILDNLIIKGVLSLSEEEANTLLCRYTKRISEFHRSIVAELESSKFDFSESGVSQFLDNCDSSKRWNIVQTLINKSKVWPKVSDLGDYQSDILSPRNALAHGIPKREGKELIFRHRDNEYRFTEEESIRLRKALKKYNEIFDRMLRC